MNTLALPEDGKEARCLTGMEEAGRGGRDEIRQMAEGLDGAGPCRPRQELGFILR